MMNKTISFSLGQKENKERTLIITFQILYK